jgi:hypothetical protein
LWQLPLERERERQHPEVFARVKAEMAYWKSIGGFGLVRAAEATSISILSLHDEKHGTRFMEKYDQNATSHRLGRGAGCARSVTPIT